MEPRLDLLTLGVPDLDVARRFYVDGLGWTPVLDLPDVVFLPAGHSRLLVLFGAADLEADVLGDGAGGAAAGGSVTLAQNVGSEAEVDAVLAQAETAGAVILKPGQQAFWGGYHGYFADPAGFRWEIAYNPGLVFGADGSVTFTEAEPPVA